MFISLLLLLLLAFLSSVISLLPSSRLATVRTYGINRNRVVVKSLSSSGMQILLPRCAPVWAIEPGIGASGINALQKEKVISAEPGIGEGCNLVSPSGINALPLSLQKEKVISALTYMIAGALGFALFFHAVLEPLNPSVYSAWRYSWPLLGVIYCAAGWAHFSLKDDFKNIYPANNAWGFYNVPGSADFHVIWTGIAELVLGSGVVIGALSRVFTQDSTLLHTSAFGLLLLTLIVTPANIFMWTHGARLPMSQPSPPVAFHYFRFAMQSLLFAMLAELSIC